jgi:hypothetical protein
VVANIGRDELRAKMDRGDPFILLGQRGDALAIALRRVVGRSGSRGPGHEHLVDAVAVHVHDLEGELSPIKAVACRRHAPEVGHHHPTHGLVVSLPSVGKPAQLEKFSELIDVHQSVHQPGAVPALHDWRPTGLLQITDESLEHVGRRDEPLDVAALFLPLDTLEAVERLFGAYAILDMTQYQVQGRSLRSAACCLPTHLDLIVYVFSDTLSGTKANQVSVQVAARIQGPDHAGAFTGSRSCVFEIYRILRAS